MAKALITGGAGFIGSHVARRFIAAGYELQVLDDLSTGRRENLPADTPLHEMRVQSADAARLVHEGGFDLLAHLAAQTDVRRSLADPVADFQTNVAGTVNLLEAVRSLPAQRRPRVVFASTGGALYGDAREYPTPESAPTDPEAPYGVAKLTAEYYLAYYARVWGLETVVLRFANVYGPRQDPGGEAGVVAIFCNRLREGRPLTVYGTGRQTRDYVFVEDVASALFVAARRALPPAGRVQARAYNIGTSVETSVIELAERLSAIAGVTPHIEFAPARQGESERSVLDVARAARELEWTPTTSLDDGLRATYEWIAGASKAAR